MGWDRCREGLRTNKEKYKMMAEGAVVGKSIERL
jgi:hypothetical protein